jgi:asparagine synthase (glutamine-hydrolysing)
MFKPLALTPDLANPDLEKAIRRSVMTQQARNGLHPVTFTAFREVAEKRYGTPAASRSQLIFRTPFLDNEIVALAYRVPESLSSSARPAWRLVEANNSNLSKIPTDTGATGESRRLTAGLRRLFLRSLFKLDYFYSEGLPHCLAPLDSFFAGVGVGVGIIGRYKFLNYRMWFRQELAAYVNESIKDARIHCSWPWNSRFLKGLAHEHISGRRNYVHEINAVITLGTVKRLLFRDLPRTIDRREPAVVELLNQG